MRVAIDSELDAEAISERIQERLAEEYGEENVFGVSAVPVQNATENENENESEDLWFEFAVALSVALFVLGALSVLLCLVLRKRRVRSNTRDVQSRVTAMAAMDKQHRDSDGDSLYIEQRAETMGNGFALSAVGSAEVEADESEDSLYAEQGPTTAGNVCEVTTMGENCGVTVEGGSDV